MVSKISGQTQLREVKKAFDAVFRSADPFNQPFNETVSHRVILFPTAPYQLDEDMYEAVASAAEAVGDTTALLTLTEGYKGGREGFESCGHWQIELRSDPYAVLSKDKEWISLVENAIYSPTGTWGLIISHEEHAVVGGPPAFVEAIKRNLPGVEDQLQEFLLTWQDYRDRLGTQIDWLPELLRHIYGTEKAHRLLLEAGLA